MPGVMEPSSALSPSRLAKGPQRLHTCLADWSTRVGETADEERNANVRLLAQGPERRRRIPAAVAVGGLQDLHQAREGLLLDFADLGLDLCRFLWIQFADGFERSTVIPLITHGMIGQGEVVQAPKLILAKPHAPFIKA